MLTAPEVADLLGSTAKNRHAYPTTLARRHRLLGVHRGGRTVFPAFQFTGDAPAAPASRLAEILSVFAANGWDVDSVALWFTAPDGYTGGVEPAAILGTDPELVLTAAESVSAPW